MVETRSCLACGNSLEGKRPHAIYCTRACKAKAAEQRRPKRDHSERYQRERDRRIAYATAYAIEKPWVGQAIRMRRKARLASTVKLLVTGKDWKRLCDRHGGACFYCGEKRPLTMDHVIPIARGGRHSIGNLVPACLSCNTSKSARFIIEVKAGRSRPRGVKTAA